MINLSKECRTCKNRLVRVLLPAAVLGLIYSVLSACKAVPAQTKEDVLPVSEVHWTYEGDTGPEYWYALDPAYAIAKDGKAQSPIDIVTSDLTVSSTLSKPVIAYHKTHFEIENNGHTIELLPLTGDNAIILDGESYALQQFHFHAPSEHLFDGRSFDMELHLVHKDNGGNLAVIGIMLTEGAYNETLGELFENSPQEISEEGKERPEVELNLADLFSADGRMYRYDGSLTTPPCTEGVKWNISVEPVEISRAQIDAFKARYQGNNRPVQNRYGRHVYTVTEQNTDK
ncbi:carbonic anhydrase [Hollandina sp. SP2]